MFDLAWSEMLVVAVIAVLAIGPKELPAVMRTIGRFVRRIQYMKYAMSQQFEDFMQQQDLNELRAQGVSSTDGDSAAEAEADEDLMEPLTSAEDDERHPRQD
jgi:sec-independent protein translocase protein TatB